MEFWLQLQLVLVLSVVVAWLESSGRRFSLSLMCFYLSPPPLSNTMKITDLLHKPAEDS